MYERREFVIHPKTIVVYLAIFGISALFFAVIASYIYNRVMQGIPAIKLPWIFFLNTGWLILATFFLRKSTKNYQSESVNEFKKSLFAALAFSLIFLLLQYIGWQMLINTGIGLTNSTTASYVYMLSGLHFVHVIGGLPFLLYFIFIVMRKLSDEVSLRLFFVDQNYSRYLDLLLVYWRFIDYLWILLVLVFGVSSLV